MPLLNRHSCQFVNGHLIVVLLAVADFVVYSPLVVASSFIDQCEKPETAWSISPESTSCQVLSHERTNTAARTGQMGEQFLIDAPISTQLQIQTPIGPAEVIDEFSAELWMRANRSNIRMAVRVKLPHFIASDTRRPVEVLVTGLSSRDINRWQRLSVNNISSGLKEQLPALHAQYGPHGSLSGAVITHLVLELYSGPGSYDISLDDVRADGVILRNDMNDRIHRDLSVQTASGIEPKTLVDNPAPVSTDPLSGLNRGVMEVDGLPFFPRVIDHNGESLQSIAALGFNCVRVREPASGAFLEEARRANVWIICPPPQLPDVDIQNPGDMPIFSSNWNRILMWDMGSGLTQDNIQELTERSRRVRACDQRSGRPIIVSADSGLRSISRHVDMVIARRTVLGTSLELNDFQTWLKERPRLMRPGTPLLVNLSTEIDAKTARQAAALSGIGGSGLTVDPESLSLAAMTAVAAGARGIFFRSTRRIDGNDPESQTRALAVQAINLKLKLLEPWAAAGRFTAVGQTSDPEVQTAVLEAARARLLLAWRSVQGAQIVARHYHGDIPNDETPLTLLVPGVPEAHQAWEVSASGLKPLKTRRVTGGVSVTLNTFHAQAMVLFSGEPGVTAHMQEKIRELAPLTLASCRALTGNILSTGSSLLGRLPPTALGTLPATSMLATAQNEALEAEALLTTDPANAILKFQRAIAIGSQLERLTWERGILATGSMVASPLSTSDATLAEHWRFINALGSTTRSQSLLQGGSMDTLEELSENGWRHFAIEDSLVQTHVEITRSNPFAGSACLTIEAAARNASEPPVVLETPPAWITTPPLKAPPGKLVEIEARVNIDAPIQASVDGLLVFDSFGGPALAERVGQTNGWQRLVLYRIAPADTSIPLTVTFAMTGLGSAKLDDVFIRVLERTGTPTTIVSTQANPSAGTGFSRPSDLLGVETIPQQPQSFVRSQTQEQQPSDDSDARVWPGLNLGWPNIFQPNADDAPPPGPGGGTIDPFKRARQ